MKDMEKVREAATQIAERGRHVRLDSEGLHRLADVLRSVCPPDNLQGYLEKSSPADGADSVHFFDGGKRTVSYALLLDAMNFCFWPEQFTVRRNGRIRGPDSRYNALAALLTRKFERGVPLWDAEYLADLSFERFRNVMQPDSGRIPLLMERWQNAVNLGQVLCQRFSGDATEVLKRAGFHAPSIAWTLSQEFDCYRDVRRYGDIEFPVLKRAQIFASDIAYLFGNRGWGKISGLDELTCFADYRLPQFMRSVGALVYTPELDERIARHEVIPEGSEEEVEIRANTIHVVESLRGLLTEHGKSPAARIIDYLIWEERVRLGELEMPHHRTITTSC